MASRKTMGTSMQDLRTQSKFNSMASSKFNMRLAEKQATKEQILMINKKIDELVDVARIKQEDMGDKFSLLKKVEVRLH